MSESIPQIMLEWLEPIGWALTTLDTMREAGFHRPWGNDAARIQHVIRITSEGMTFACRESEKSLSFSEIDYVGFWKRETPYGEIVGMQVIDNEPDESDLALDTPARIPALTRILAEHGITVHDGTGLAQPKLAQDSGQERRFP